MILLAILFPGISFLLRGKIIQGIIALVLQVIAIITSIFFGIGFFIWLAIAIWAIISYNNGKAGKRHKEVIKTMQMQNQKNSSS